MTAPLSNTRTIEVDEQVYELLERTAASRNTDINGALSYLIEVPAVPTVSPTDEDE